MTQTTLPLGRVPVWAWRLAMAQSERRERKRFNAKPLTSVEYTLDIDYAGEGHRLQRLDVISPKEADRPLPVYVYFHGGGWTSGDKAALTRYCAIQAERGMVVVNVNYRMAPRHHLRHMLHDACAALEWVAETIADFGGDPDRLIVGGDSAGGHIAALVAAMPASPELAAHYGLDGRAPTGIVGTVQHCSALDFSVVFEKGFVMGLGFVRMLLPSRIRRGELRAAARLLSPIEWIGPYYPPTLLTTSRRDFFYGATMNFAEALRSHGVPVQSWVSDNALHTWQQNSFHPDSREVYARLHAFVELVTEHATVA